MKKETRDLSSKRTILPILRVSRTKCLLVTGGLLGLLANASPGRAQNAPFVVMQEQHWGTAVVTTLTTRERGAAITVTSDGRTLRLTLRPTELEAWADSVLTVLRNALAVPPSGKVEVRVGPLQDADGGRLELVRTTTAAGVDNAIAFVGPTGGEPVAFTLTDSLVRPFALAARSAATAEVVMAGDQCARVLASAIAKLGQPAIREHGSVNATELFEKLTWKTGSRLRTLRYVWGSANRGCRTEEP